MIPAILDACLDDIQEHGATIADCLAKYPEYGEELKPLLEVALALLSGPDVKPSKDFKAALRDRLMGLPDPTSEESERAASERSSDSRSEPLETDGPDRDLRTYTQRLTRRLNASSGSGRRKLS